MPQSQLRKGALEIVILGLLDSQPAYGGQLLDRLAQEAGLEVSQGTAYPLLARLRKGGLVTTHWEESPAGPPRKIYTLSARGKERMLALAAEWAELDDAVHTALKHSGGFGHARDVDWSMKDETVDDR